MRTQTVRRRVLSPAKAFLLHCKGQHAVPVLCIRLQSTAPRSPPVLPPQPRDTTSISGGLNLELHPTGRHPTLAKAVPSIQSESPLQNPAQSTPPTADPGGRGTFRTPLRVQRTNIPVSVKDSVKVVYQGPLKTTVRGLKAFSASSLVFSVGVTPWLLTMEASLPMVARVSMVSVAVGASLLSTGLINYFLSPYVIRATYMSLSHQLNLENYSLFARRKNNVVNVDDLRRIEGEGYRMHVNVKNEADGRVWYIQSNPQDLAKEFWETLDRPRGGYKDVSGRAVTFKAKVSDNPEARVFEEDVPISGKK